eukprot:7172895-Ditylum_brightwellii.AAC.1
MKMMPHMINLDCQRDTSDVELMDDKCAILNHLGRFQCTGFGEFSFAEAQHIPHKLQPQWTEAVIRVTQDIVDSLHQSHPHTHHHKRAKKSPDKAKMRASLLGAILTQRIAHWTTGQWYKLVKDTEAD